MVVAEIIKRLHYVSVYDVSTLPPIDKLLECDVLIDMSSNTDFVFYTALDRAHKERLAASRPAPMLVDDPRAVMTSLDKRLTHRLFADLVPESHDLAGTDNVAAISKFIDEEFVVVKPALGWGGHLVERLTVQSALAKHCNSQNFVVQKYIAPYEGIGRIVTLLYRDDFEIVCAYRRLPTGWRTGVDTQYSCVEQPITDELYRFAEMVSRRSGLYLNGIDYIENCPARFTLLEVNAVPAMREPYDAFGVDIPKALISHVERNFPRGSAV